MNITIFFLALFHSVFLGNQDDPVALKYNVQEATLCLGDNMVLGDKEIRFKEVISDSRCPKRVSCIWAGKVKVLMEFYEDGKLKGDKIIAGTNISMGDNDINAGVNISIAEFFKNTDLNIREVMVTPYPDANHKIDQEEYTVELSISESVEK